MQKLNLNTLIEYDDERCNPKVLMGEPGYRMVLLSMRAERRVPEHESKGMVIQPNDRRLSIVRSAHHMRCSWRLRAQRSSDSYMTFVRELASASSEWTSDAPTAEMVLSFS